MLADEVKQKERGTIAPKMQASADFENHAATASAKAFPRRPAACSASPRARNSASERMREGGQPETEHDEGHGAEHQYSACDIDFERLNKTDYPGHDEQVEKREPQPAYPRCQVRPQMKPGPPKNQGQQAIWIAEVDPGRIAAR